MSTLVIGGTGQIGSLVLQELADRGATARVLTTDPGKVRLPDGMSAVKGDLLEPASMREVLRGVDTMFMLNAVSPSESTQALIALDLAREAKVSHIVYFSQIVVDWPDCPHTAAKANAEALVRYHHLPATILRPDYFFQNDAGFKEQILKGTYPMPLGSKGLDMVDARDIATAAAIAILDQRAVSDDPILEIVGPQTITGESAAEVWSTVTGTTVTYAGDDLVEFEQQQAQRTSGWQAHDLVTMLRNCQRDGAHGKPGSAERLAKLIGRPLRRYRDFAAETFVKWQKG